MAREIAVTQAREELAELVNRVAYGHERIVLTRHGRPVAALVSQDDLAVLEQHDSGGPNQAGHADQRIRLTHTGEAGGQAAAARRQPADPAEPLRIAAERNPDNPGMPPSSP
jgi:prevent-host-death family protein